MTPQPSALYPGPSADNLLQIPRALILIPHWILWRGRDRVDQATGGVKLNKIPVNPHDLTNADTTDPQTWGTLTDAMEALPLALEEWETDDPAAYRGGGLGFVFTENDPYVGIDLDGCVDPVTGVIEPWAQDIITRLDSYCEITPSSTGLHVIICGTLPPRGRHKGAIEMYSTQRFFTMTGWRVTTAPETVEHRQPQLDALWAHYFGARVGDTVWCLDTQQNKTNHNGIPWAITAIVEAPDGTPYAQFAETATGWPLTQCDLAPMTTGQTTTPLLDDATIIAKASTAANKTKLLELAAGQWQHRYASQSEADLALCIMLAFWTQDAAQLDHLFRTTGLMRPKWDEQRGALTYGQRTITEALARQTQHYTPSAATGYIAPVYGTSTHGTNGTTPAPTATGTSAASPWGTPGQVILKKTKAGRPHAVLLNILDVLKSDPHWTDVFAYDELADDVTLRRSPPYLAPSPPWHTRPIRDEDYSEVANWLQRQYDLCTPTALVTEAVNTIAHRAPYHPIRDYLKGLAWDGTARLDTWLATYCGADDTPYTRAVGAKTLIAAVARVAQPGAKVDTMTILEGAQGRFKSTVWRTLASDPWYSDTLPDLHNKDAPQSLRGKWIVELGELAALRRSEVEAVKRFLSATQDHYRPSYGRRARTFLRNNIFVGTTNADDYLKDTTGNRRFWPVAVHGTCAIAALQHDRDQLWAEAYARYTQGEPWHLTSTLEALAEVEQAQREEVDPWEAPVLDYITGRPFVTTQDLLTKALGLDVIARASQADTKRLGAILRRQGWESNKLQWVGGVQVKGWKPPAV